MSKGIAVIDIGSTGVRVLVAKISEGRNPQIIAKADAACKNAIKNLMIENTEEVSQAIKRVFAKIKDQTGLIVRSAYVGISGEKINFMPNTDSIVISREDDDPETAPVTSKTIGILLDRIASVELYEDESLIDVIPRQFYAAYDERQYDTKVTDPTGLTCTRIKADADVIVAKGNYMDSVRKCAADAGIEIDGFIPYSLALPKVVPAEIFAEDKQTGFDDEYYVSKNDEKSVLVIDVGGCITEYVLYYKGMPYTVGALPCGGANITSDLAVVMNISVNEAEQLKLDYPLADDELVTNDLDIEIYPLDAGGKDIVKVSYVVQIMKARIENIFDSVYGELENEGIDSSLIDSIVLTGEGISNFKGLDSVCRNILGHVPTIADGSRQTGMKPSYSYACGMIRYMSGQMKYGRKASKISRECQLPTEEQTTEPEPKKGIINSLRGRIRTMIESFRD